MEKSVQLSNRLLKVASYIPEGSKFADIGSDHAYLPCYICLKDKTAKAIAGEVNRGPYESAIKTVKSYQLGDAIEVRLGNGLEVIEPIDEVDHIVIAGMGGSLIKDILENGKSKLHSVKRIVAQPNVDARNVRKWLFDNNFYITNEEIIEENDHIYEIVVADKVDTKDITVPSEKELLFGPKLLETKSEVFYKKWRNEFEKLKKVILQMKQAKNPNRQKIEQFQEEIQWIGEVINNGK